MDRTSVGCRLRTLQLRIKDRRDEEVEVDVWRQLRWAAAITRDCLSTITGAGDQASGVWRPFGAGRFASPDLNAIRAAGLRLGVSTHDDWKSTSRWQHAPLISRWDMCSDANQTDAFCTAGAGTAGTAFERLADYPTVAIGGISLARALR